MSKDYVWWAHYNKPMFQKTGLDIMTVHYKGKCRYVRGFEILPHSSELVPIAWTQERKQQPRIVLKGNCKGISWVGYDEQMNTWEHARIYR
jgi:hypothetical protein